jgi:hypothetical protein
VITLSVASRLEVATERDTGGERRVEGPRRRAARAVNAARAVARRLRRRPEAPQKAEPPQPEPLRMISGRGGDILAIEPINGLGPTAGTDALQRVRGPYPDEGPRGP